jgi:hypothetical protein
LGQFAQGLLPEAAVPRPVERVIDDNYFVTPVLDKDKPLTPVTP